METNRLDTAEIDDDLSVDLPIAAIAHDNGMLELSDAYDDCRPYLHAVIETVAIANMTTRSRKA